MQWLSILSTLIGAYCLSIVWTLFSNYSKAGKSGFPVYVCPTNPGNPFWMLSSVPLRPLLFRLLPTVIFERILPTIYGWEYWDRYSTFARFGPAFILVTPGKNELWVADVELANTILARRKDFNQPEMTAFVIGLFGQNLITSNGDDWQRHRKLVAPNLNESISSLVWTESCNQAREMLGYYANNNQGETDKTIDGMRLIAMHVLGNAGYGVSQPWEQGDENAQADRDWNYVDAVAVVINNIIASAVTPTFVYTLPFIPDSVRAIGRGLREFPVLTRGMLEAERHSAAADARVRNNMMSTLVRLSDEAKDQDAEVDKKNSQYLSEDEILGNLFLFTAAGYDTNANTLAYAVTTLAVYPELQDWICEEIDREVVVGHEEVPDYAKIFPRLVRCLALMYETLRLYTPVMHITRYAPSPQEVTTTTTTHHIPADTVIYINTSALHTNPETWGKDSLEFRPTRWLSKNSIQTEEFLITMPRGTFLPWSGGPRVCPGQKMSQVEFVGVFATIFRRYRCTPVLEDGETEEEAKERFKETMHDSRPRLTLQMNKPQSVKLRWYRR